MKKLKPKKLKYVPPTPEERLLILRDQRSGLSHLVTQRKRLGQFDANSDAIISTLEAALDIIDYLISLNERDKKHEQSIKTKR